MSFGQKPFRRQPFHRLTPKIEIFVEQWIIDRRRDNCWVGKMPVSQTVFDLKAWNQVSYPLRSSFPELTFSGDDVLVSGGGDDDVHLAQDVLDPDHPEAVHASLESGQGIKVSNILLCKTMKMPNSFVQFTDQAFFH